MPELLNKSLLTAVDGRSLGLQTVGRHLQTQFLGRFLNSFEEIIRLSEAISAGKPLNSEVNPKRQDQVF